MIRGRSCTTEPSTVRSARSCRRRSMAGCASCCSARAAAGRAAEPEWEPDRGLTGGAGRQLTAYFEGKLRDFEMPLAPEGTAFQRAVWSELASDPLRRDHQLRRVGPPARQSQSGPRGRPRQRLESDFHHHPLPPRDRQQRFARRLRRRAARSSKRCWRWRGGGRRSAADAQTLHPP